jgi:serine/threonine protein phosphatase 1
VQKRKQYVIGDVHGCYHTLTHLINKLPSDAELIFVGDIYNKGRYAKEVIELVIKNNHRCIRGNHEEAMFGRLTSEDSEVIVQGYHKEKQMLKRHIAWLESLPHYMMIDNYFITHGFGLPYYQRKDEANKAHAIMNNRLRNEKSQVHDWEDGWQEYDVINIYGHERTDEIYVGRNFYGIDTGCASGNKLTALELGSMQTVQVELDQRDIA